MLFNSLTFLLFLAVVLAGYYASRNWTVRKSWLLLASYAFYAAWSPPFVLLLMGSSVFDWWLARRIAASEDPARRRVWLVFSLLSNLGLLGYFKYGGFLLHNFTVGAAALGIDYAPVDWNIVLPVGISFYTFQSLSYTIDVYRRNLRADWKLTDFLLFVSFFPQLVAGPIVRANDFLPQLATPRQATRDDFGWGCCLFVMGLFCKMVMADSALAPAVDPVYAHASAAGTLDAWTAVAAFSGQIYYDFAGYSICAMGLALMFGFRLPENFNRPYAATGFSDFWRRWHISLSSWLRDYLYVPLGGNRAGARRTGINLMLTMLLGGLWHGASWLFVAWGLLHGLYLALERAWRVRFPPLPGGWTVVAIAGTFLVVTLTWIPFRAGTIDTLLHLLQALRGREAAALLDPLVVTTALLAMAATLLWQAWHRNRPLGAWYASLAPGARIAVIATALFTCYLCAGDDQHAFIYFQF